MLGIQNKKRSARRIILTILLTGLAIGSAPAAHAQTKEETLAKIITITASNLLDSAMHVRSARAADFNEHIAAINQARPLEAANLDSAHVNQNISRTLNFIEYLKQYRASGKVFINQFEDSIFILVSNYPPVREKHLIKDLGDAYMADDKAFDKYVSALSTIYSQVLDVLLFLHHTPYEVKNNAPEFRSAKDNGEYRKLVGQLDDLQKQASSAAAASRKSTAIVQKKLREFNKIESNDSSPQ